MIALKAENITKYYYVNRKKRIIFHNLSLSLAPGVRLGILGPNGAGKSTLLRVLSGVEYPNRGKVIRSCRISWPVGITHGFIPTLTGKENMRFICRLHACSSSEGNEKIDFVRQFADLGEHFDIPVNTYSSGMMARLAFGMTLSFDFDFYLVDESFAVGDIVFRQKSLDAFNSKAEGKGMILVSHDTQTLKDYCTQGAYLNQGKLIYSESLDEVINLYNESAGRSA